VRQTTAPAATRDLPTTWRTKSEIHSIASVWEFRPLRGFGRARKRGYLSDLHDVLPVCLAPVRTTTGRVLAERRRRGSTARGIRACKIYDVIELFCTSHLSLSFPDSRHPLAPRPDVSGSHSRFATMMARIKSLLRRAWRATEVKRLWDVLAMGYGEL
jgi:hypothetical protein